MIPLFARLTAGVAGDYDPAISVTAVNDQLPDCEGDGRKGSAFKIC